MYAGCDLPPRSGVQRCGVPTPDPGLLARHALAVGITGLLVASCGTGDAARACGEVEREPLDPGHVVHVLGDDAGVTYASDPPTSGPHQAAPAVSGVVGTPLTQPVQVGILERGDVLVQHLPDLADDQIEALEALAGDRVVVAPNPDLPSAVVATAWTHVRRCTDVDVGALRAFIRDRAGKGPEG